MASRDTRGSSHERQISQIRDQLQRLLPERAAPALAGAADSAAIPIQKLLGYAKLAADIFPQLRQLVRGSQTPPPAIRPGPGLLRRHPVLASTVAIGLALGVGSAAYKLTRGQSFRRRPAHSASRAGGDRSETGLR